MKELYEFGMAIENSGLAKAAVKATDTVLNKLLVLFCWENRDLDASNIHCKLRLARRYAAWMHEAGILPWNPEQWQIRLFVQEQHSKGSLAAKAALQSLQWLCGIVRLDIGANEEEVKATAMAAQPSLAKHAPPATVKVWMALEAGGSCLGKRVSGGPCCNLDTYVCTFCSHPEKLHCKGD